MPARTKGRAKFNFRGRTFLWYITDDGRLHIHSLDKKFVIAVPLLRALNEPHVVDVIGQDFPGLDRTTARPIRIGLPEFATEANNMGALVNAVLRWAFDARRSPT